MVKGYLYDNGYELISREEALPDTSEASEGDILSLNSEKEPEWSTPESGLPDTSEASAGDVLSLDSDKEPVWSAPSGGGGIFVVELDVQSASDVISDGEGGYYYKTNATIANTIGIGMIPVCGEFSGGDLPTLISPRTFPAVYDTNFIEYRTDNGDVYLVTLDDHGDTLYLHVVTIG